MIINSKTKISALIKANPEAIDVIASINPHFRKLQNPFLRRILAKRVTIADAAKIGGTTVQVFFEKLSTIGFEVEGVHSIDSTGSEKSNAMAGKFNLDNQLILDVRPDIKGGQDPFQRIMKTIKTLPDDQVLCVVNVFEPIPLINLLQSKGYDFYVERPEAGLVHTYFKRNTQATIEEEEPVEEQTEELSFDSWLQSFCRRLVTIDVRALPMPEPMVAILSELEKLPEHHALFVHHKKFPQFLIPELKKRGYRLLSKETDDNQVELIIWKV